RNCSRRAGGPRASSGRRRHSWRGRPGWGCRCGGSAARSGRCRRGQRWRWVLDRGAGGWSWDRLLQGGGGSLSAEILCRNLVHQPDPVVRTVEKDAGLVHRLGVHDEHDRLAVPLPDLRRRRHVLRQMHVVSAHLLDAVGEDGGGGVLGGAVVEHGGGGGGGATPNGKGGRAPGWAGPSARVLCRGRRASAR